MTVLTWVCWSMISETYTQYGSWQYGSRLQGKSLAFAAYHGSRAATRLLTLRVCKTAKSDGRAATSQGERWCFDLNFYIRGNSTHINQKRHKTNPNTACLR